jgi:hypothetical protein
LAKNSPLSHRKSLVKIGEPLTRGDFGETSDLSLNKKRYVAREEAEGKPNDVGADHPIIKNWVLAALRKMRSAN